jgi:hypothetical protein
MGMRKSTRQELRKLRELCQHFLEDMTCMFCHEPLVGGKNHYGHGDGEGSPLDIELTIHHKDGNHRNNAKKNRKVVHRRCHKSFHMAERHAAKRKGKK